MATERQINANRRNARLSTGPRTTEGRSASCLNGLVHGLRSQLIAIPGENPSEFQTLFDGFVEEARPESLRDLAAVRKIASCEWRLRRLASIENEMFAQAIQQAAILPAASVPFSNDHELLIARMMASQQQPPRGEASPAALLARHFLAGGSNPFNALSRYEASLERQYRNAWRELDSRPISDFASIASTEPVAGEAQPECAPALPDTSPDPPNVEPAPAAQLETAQAEPNPKSGHFRRTRPEPRHRPLRPPARRHPRIHPVGPRPRGPAPGRRPRP